MSNQARDATSTDASTTPSPFCLCPLLHLHFPRPARLILHNTTSACTSLSGWHHIPGTSLNKQYTLTTCYDDQKFWNMFGERRGVTIIWDMFMLGPRDIKCFHAGLPLTRRLYSLPLQCDGSHGLTIKPKSPAAFSLVYDVHTTPTNTLFIYTRHLHHRDLPCIWRKQIDFQAFAPAPFCSALIHLFSFCIKRSNANY